jgi:hypothetical protein
MSIGCAAFTARVLPAALAAVLAGLATIPPAHGGTPGARCYSSIKFRDPANICATHEIPDKTGSPSGVWEPAFQQPCAELYAKQVAAWVTAAPR